MTSMRDCGCNPEFPFPAAMIHKSQLISILKLLMCRSSRKEWLQQVIADFDEYNRCECESCHVVIGVDPPLMKHCLCCSPEPGDRSLGDDDAAACFARNPAASSVGHSNAAVQTVAPEVEWFEDFVHLPIFQQLKLMLICIKQLLLRKQHLTGSLTHKEHNIYCRVFAEIRYLCKNEQQLCGKPVPNSVRLPSNSVDSDDQALGMGHYFCQLTATHCNAFTVLQHCIPEVLLEALSCLLQNTSERASHETVSCTSRVSVDYWTCDHQYKLHLYDSDGCRIAFYSMLGSESSAIDVLEQDSLMNCFKKVELCDTGISQEGLLESSAKIINEVLAPPWLAMLYKYYKQLSSLDQFMEDEDKVLPDWEACTAEDLSTVYRAWSLSNSNREVIKYLVRAMHHYISIESEMRKTCPMFVDSSCVQENILLTVRALKNLEQVPLTLWPERVVKLVCDRYEQRTATGMTKHCQSLREKGRHFTLSSSRKLQPAVSRLQEFRMAASSRLNESPAKVKWFASGSCTSRSQRRPSGKTLPSKNRLSSLSLDEIRSSNKRRLASRSLVRQRSSASSSSSSRSSSLSSGEIGSTSDHSGSSSSSEIGTGSSPTSSSTSSSSSSTSVSSFDSLKCRRSHCRHHGKVRPHYRLTKKYRPVSRSFRQKSSVKEYSLSDMTSSSTECESSSTSEALTASPSSSSSSSSSATTLSCHGSDRFCDSATYRRLYSRSSRQIMSVNRHSPRSTSSGRRRARAKELVPSAYESKSFGKHDNRKEVSGRHLGGSRSHERTVPKKHSHKESRDKLQSGRRKFRSTLSSSPPEYLEPVTTPLLPHSGFSQRCSEERESRTGAAMLASHRLENITSVNKSDVASCGTAEPLRVKINTKMELDAVGSFVHSSENGDYDFYMSRLGIASSYLGTKESLEFGDLWQSIISDCPDGRGCALEEEPHILAAAAAAAEDQVLGGDATVLDAPREQAMTSEPENRKANEVTKRKLRQKYSHQKAALRRVKVLPSCVRCHHVMAKAVTSFCSSSSWKNKTTTLALDRSRPILGKRFCHKCRRVKRSHAFSAHTEAKMEGMPSGSEFRKRSFEEAMRTEEFSDKDDVSVLPASHPGVARSCVDSCATAVKHSSDLQASYSWSGTETKKVDSTANVDWSCESKIMSHQSGFNNNEEGDDIQSVSTISSSQTSAEFTPRVSNLMEKSKQDNLDPYGYHFELVQHCAAPVLGGVAPAEHSAEPVLSEVVPAEHSAEPMLSDMVPAEHSTEPVLSGMVPTEHSAEPVLSEVVPAEHSTEPVLSDVVPAEHSTEPVLSGVVPTEHSAELVLSDVVPAEHSGEPVLSEVVPTENSSEPVWRDVVPAKYSTEPMWRDVVPAKHSAEPMWRDVVPTEHSSERVKCCAEPSGRDSYSSTLGQCVETFTARESPVHSDCWRMKQVKPVFNDLEPGTSYQKPVTSPDRMEEPGDELVHPSAELLVDSSKFVKASHVDNGSSVVNDETLHQSDSDNGDELQRDRDVGNESMQHDGAREMEQNNDANVIPYDEQRQCCETSQQVSSMQVEHYDTLLEVGGTAEESSRVALESNHIDLEASDIAVEVGSMATEVPGVAAEAVDRTAACSNMMVDHNDLTMETSPKPNKRSVEVVERDRRPSRGEEGLDCLANSDCSPHHKHQDVNVTHLDRGINLPEITEPSLCFNESSFMSGFSDTDDEGDLPAVLMSRNSQSSPAPDHHQQAASDSQVNQNNEAHPMPVLHSGDGEKKMADLRLMLDFMLTEKIDKLEDNRKLAAQVDELNEDLRKGGINKFSMEDLSELEETELLPEHKAKLKQFEIQNCQISGEAPGLHLFDCAKVQCLFSFPTMLTLSVCGFVPGRSSLDKMLATADPDCITELLNSQMIQMCFESLSSPDVIMDWLFLLLSDVTGELVSCSSLKTLLDLLQRDHGKASHWIPTPLTLARVLVNYGASLSMLLPVEDLVDFTDSDLSLTNNKENSQPDSNPVMGQVLPPADQWCYYDGLGRVVRVVAEAVHKRSHLYSVKDLLAITVMLLRVSIDKNLNNNCLMHDLRLCLSAILNAIPQEKWNSYISQLCQIAPQLASHHHNLLQLVEVLPPSERGITLQHHLAYVFLHYLSFGDCKQDFMDLKIRDLLPIVRSFHVGEGTDFYRLYSLCVLLDRCISKKTLPVSEKADLKVLCDMLKCLMGSVRECITDLDRSIVKELLTQLISILSIKLESMGFRQRTLFDYCLPPPEESTSLAVDQIEDNQSDDDIILDSQSEVSRPCE